MNKIFLLIVFIGLGKAVFGFEGLDEFKEYLNSNQSMLDGCQKHLDGNGIEIEMDLVEERRVFYIESPVDTQTSEAVTCFLKALERKSPNYSKQNAPQKNGDFQRLTHFWLGFTNHMESYETTEAIEANLEIPESASVHEIHQSVSLMLMFNRTVSTTLQLGTSRKINVVDSDPSRSTLVRGLNSNLALHYHLFHNNYDGLLTVGVGPYIERWQSFEKESGPVSFNEYGVDVQVNMTVFGKNTHITFGSQIPLGSLGNQNGPNQILETNMNFKIGVISNFSNIILKSKSRKFNKRF